MSEQQPEVVELPTQGDAAFVALMDALAPGSEGASVVDTAEAPAAGGAPAAGAAEAGAAGGAPAPADGAAGGAGAPAAPAGDAQPAGDGGAGQAGAQPGAGEQAAGAGADGGAGAGAGGGDAGPGGAGAGAAGFDVAPVVTQLGELSNALETRTQEAFQQEAFTAVQTEHAKYFEALGQHPRMLVGQKVPSLSGNGQDTLRDSADAKEWQDGVRHLLAEEVRSRAGKAMEENAGFMQTMHASIELFQNNPDLIPGAQGFDRELADRFATLVTPYELRNDGKLQGYSIPVQPILEQVRAALKAERDAKAAAGAAAPQTGAQPPAGAQAPAQGQQAAQQPPAQPQAGIQSKAGAESQEEGFGALWGTLGLPDLRL